MSNRYKKKLIKESKDLRVMVKFGWNGSRVSIPTTYKITTRSTLMQVIEGIQTDVPSVIFEGLGMEIEESNKKEPTLLHMRNCVERSQWNNMTLEDVGVEGGGSALLTLNLGGVIAPNMSKNPSSSKLKSEKVDDRKMAAVPTSSPPVISATPTISATQTNTNTNINTTTPSTISCEDALEKLVISHFDADSQECVKTLIKVIDNIIHKPGEPKTRSIRLQNAAFWKKVGSKTGGVEFLLACGFTGNTPILNNNLNQNVTLELKPENESSSKLFSARQLLHKYALKLGISSDDVAPLRKPKPSPSVSTTSSSQKSFDPFKAHSFNVQAASVGAPNPNGVTPDGSTYMSNTERELDKLNKRAKQLETEFKKKPLERDWVAFLPGQQPQQQDQNSGDLQTSGSSRGDGALLAQRMKRMEEERKKREEGGFTTKAMRDLEKMKKAKLFTHAQLRICFPDGISISANFHPNEKIETVQKLIVEETLVPNTVLDNSFELYVTPPRRILPMNSTLVDEGLLPAARVFVLWKNGASPPPGTSYVKSELFGTSTVSAFPESKMVSENNNEGNSSGGILKGKKSVDGGARKKLSEEELMNRMMGGGKLFRRKKATGDEKSDSKGGMKPSWFKK